MNKSLENFKKYLPLLQQFVKRDFKTKYRRSVLGILWSVLNPLGMMLVMSVVFSHLFRAGIENFPVYLMCGQLVFNRVDFPQPEGPIKAVILFSGIPILIWCSA